MTAAGGFHDRKSTSPTSFALVVGLHAAALGALALAKTTVIDRYDPPITVENIPLPKDPEPVPPPPPREATPEAAPPISRMTTAEAVVELPAERPSVIGPPANPPSFPEMVGTSTTTAAAITPDLPPMRIDAEFDPRFADQLQPPYPASEQRAEREGTVRVRVTIGADGRVKAVERLSATSDAFWRATERHALSRWRFRPATVDGRPVESVKTLTLHFQLEA